MFVVAVVPLSCVCVCVCFAAVVAASCCLLLYVAAGAVAGAFAGALLLVLMFCVCIFFCCVFAFDTCVVSPYFLLFGVLFCMSRLPTRFVLFPFLIVFMLLSSWLFVCVAAPAVVVSICLCLIFIVLNHRACYDVAPVLLFLSFYVFNLRSCDLMLCCYMFYMCVRVGC